MQASIESPEAESQVQSNEMEFYVVSPKKFLILFIGTFSLYTVYWFFKHWSQYKKSTNEDMWPIMRGIFSIFFTHSLFALFEMKYTNKTGEKPKSINYLATIYVVFAIGCQIFGKLSDNDYGNPITFFLSLLVLPVSCWVLYQAQSLANFAGEDVHGDSNSNLTGLNYFWLALGVVFWFLAVFGLYASAVGM
jgi:multisubunit Na+/H+ antiporter MnhG subunit